MIVQTLDRKIWRKDLVTEYLYKCHMDNTPAVIEFSPEGSCAEALGMYRLLDDFCTRTGYPKNQITIITGNVLENHPEYKIKKDVTGCWYELREIKQWLKGKLIPITNNPTKHFANFISRSNWFRLWTATILNKYYGGKTLQTYHYDPDKENYNANGYIGLDDLVRYRCDIVEDAVKFINSCPRTIDIEYLENLENSKDSIFQHENSYYPIQHPSNLNLLQYYNDIFVDVIVEPNISGNCFLVTEKFWRCVIAKRPFILVAPQNHLSNLHRLGFKSFNGYWSEDYDGYTNGDRIKMIESVILEISNWSIEDLHNKLIDMQDVLDHNHQTFMNLLHYDIIKEFN